MSMQKIINNSLTFPDIFVSDTDNNPCIFSPNAIYSIFMFQTRDTLFADTDTFGRFINNAIKNFRASEAYTHYKAHLFDLGMTRCQMLGNIDVTMFEKKGGIEMHHNGITIFDIALMICHHLLATKGKCCTLDIFHELKKCHFANHVPLVMLCETMHQMTHNNTEFFIPCSMTFGFWTELLNDYKFGITYDIAKKIYYWIKISLEHDSNDANLNRELIGLGNNIERWSCYNEYRMGNNRYNGVNPGTRFDRLSNMSLFNVSNKENNTSI